MDLFYIPKGSKIPLHDHPMMYVFSKIIYGKCEVSAF